MTFLSSVQQFYREMGYSGAVPSTVVGQTSQKRKAVDWVAEAAYLIDSRWFDWDYMWAQHSVATAPGTANYSAPSDLGTWDTESFYLNYSANTHQHLDYIPYKQWRKEYRQGTKTNALPDMFTVLPDKTVTLEAPPDAVYTLTADYWKEPTKMTADADTPAMPDKFERIIVVRAKVLHAEHFGDQGLMQVALGEYAELLDRLEADQLPDRHDRLSESAGQTIVVQ